ncbi:MAG: TonB family protein [Nitrospinaceae bacterium]|nr:TonB family protein [Nitrospinaceae bacterium]NIR56579.1 TonB family protein [Nitrospinaceae bacterium]NIS87041.1 TonB family protein [Nitrospinaceae bacterium]NIT83885.1 TonB family protein [Nitrospinaceae bacterium]NIU46088.1 TonB family protein [Nitrospinaceae bacterium]
MRTSRISPIDFNRMLVVSVFFHFFLFTVLMFLPHSQNIPRIIKPDFIVKIVDIPQGFDQPPVPVVEKPRPVAEKPKPVAEKPRPVAEKPKPVAEKPPPPKKPKASKALVSKLDQLAKLEKQKVVAPKKPILDDTFREQKTPRKTAVDKNTIKAPRPEQNVLEDFKKIKMREKAPAVKKFSRKSKEDLSMKEKKFKDLSSRTAENKAKQKPRKSSQLMKDLDQLAKLNQKASAALEVPKPVKNKTHRKSTELIRRLDSIKDSRMQIKIDLKRVTSEHSRKFKSEIRSVKLMEKVPNKSVPTPATSGEPGEPGADMLQKYLGLVYRKVFEHWKDPLGGGDGKVQVSFSIFPKGNIAMPKILKKSGDPKLDNLALLAVKNAQPFPPFPKELKEPNLPLVLNFSYVPKK